MNGRRAKAIHKRARELTTVEPKLLGGGYAKLRGNTVSVPAKHAAGTYRRLCQTLKSALRTTPLDEIPFVCDVLK